ncbi:MAG: beta strand repeat-containing protein, partial [Bacteroidota bacterium]
MKKHLLFLLFVFIFCHSAFAQAPVNDEPCNAIPLTAGTSCNYVTGTTTNATATSGVPAPGCANYLGGDVWFSVTVPASGSLLFDSNTGTVTDGGMAIYSGTCSNLTLITCDDDGSANGLMPSITANGLTPGSTVFIRFWEYGNDNPGDFSICVEQLTPCASNSTNASCSSADPFCTGTSYDYCNTTNVASLGGGGIYGCCLSTPNPAFYFMNIQSTGPITFNISQTTNAGVGIDVDFVLWGPFASQAAMCAGLATNNIVDCSYSTAAVETATIPNAVAGQWYMMLITNFSNQPGSIQFNQTNSNTVGSGSTNCNLLTAIPGACSGGYFTLTGSVDVPAPPTTGTLTIANSSGGSQVFNAPFASNISYSIPNICGDGNQHSVTAVFSAGGAPIILPATYLAPSCNTLTATPGPCIAGQYTLTGTLTTNSCMPATGTLTISSSCGGSITFNAPFTSPLNWTLPASNGNGGNCTIKAIYSAVGAPTIDSIIIAEPQCCGANAGTVTVTANNGTVTTSGTNTQVTLCSGGTVSIVSNNDYVLPPSYDPGFDDAELFYAIYLPPGPTVPDPDLDPNWTGYYWTGQDFTANAYATNSSSCGSPLLNLPGISSANNTLVFVPLTADDGDNGVNFDGVVAHDQNGDGCFDVGNPIAITFLNPITFNASVSCAGAVSIQISGGYPEFLSGLYSVTNTGSGTINATSATAGGSVTISGLSAGQTYSISVTDAGGCGAITFSGVYQGPPTINLTATPSTICLGQCSNLNATINSGVTAGNTTLTTKECAAIADGGISGTNGNPTINTGNWAHTCIEVGGVCDQVWNTGDVLSVKLNLLHTYDADLDIYLQAPNGVYYLLAQDLGAGGDNYTNTVFSATGAAVIAGGAAAAPFTGTFKPMGTGNNFSAFNGTSINGSWCLWVGDDLGGDAGSIQNWSITLANQTTYTYSWSPTTNLSATNILNPVACPTSSTTYTLTVTNACGCTSTASVPITVNPPVVPTFNQIGPICAGTTAPALPTTSLNGIPGTWLPATISNTTSGSYLFTPAVGQCATTTTLSVVVVPVPTVTSVITNPLCIGNANGSIDVTATGGTAPYTYQWSNGSTNQDLSGLSAGTYTVTVSTANGCTATLSNAVNAPIAVNASIFSTTNINCFGQSTGAITAIGNGGTSPYTYLWSNGATTNIINGLPSGSYTVTVTDANGCMNNSVVSATLTQQPLLSISMPTVTNVSCYGGANGSINTNSSGGTPTYTYLWSNGSNSANASGLSVGTYTVTVTDLYGCTATTSSVILQPTQLTIAIPSTTNVLCNGASTGSATALASNGTANYTYQWNNGATTASISNLTAGTYTVTATDSKGCTISSATTITQPSLLTAAIPSSTNVLCNGGATGAATATALNGTPNYTFLWNTGSTTATINNLTAGTYTVTATDVNGCTASASVSIAQPVLLTVSIPSSANVLCNGGSTGSATALALNGTFGYTYQWNTGTVTATNNNLASGTYTVTATDANGCTALANIVITQPSPLVLTPSSTISTCGQLNGTASINVVGGVSAYTYLWSGGQTTSVINNVASGGYVVTVTDANGCSMNAAVNVGSAGGPTVNVVSSNNVSCFGGTNGNAQVNVSSGTGPFIYSWLPSGGNSSSATNLAAGSYSVNVTDANGCTSSVSVVITQPSLLTIAIPSTTNVLCNGGNTGAATASSTNGTSGYTYLWNNGATTSTINNLTAGTYTVTTTDANGCTATTTATIAQPTSLSVAIPSTTNVLCNGGATGAATALASNGTANYTYQWNTGATTSTISNLTAGTYTVTTTDANGCTATTTTTITQPTLLSVTIPSTTNVLCNGGNTGSATASSTNGTSGYTYLWNNGSTTSTINNLTAGTYTVTTTDANGCTATTTATITQPTLLSVAIPSTTNVLCNGGNTGAATASSTNGTSGYTYLWNNGSTTSTINNLTAGTYTVTTTDANG